MYPLYVYLSTFLSIYLYFVYQIIYTVICLWFTVMFVFILLFGSIRFLSGLKGIIGACIRFLMISTGFWKCQSGFVWNGTEYLNCYSFYTEPNYSFSYKFLFGRIICIRLKPTPMILLQYSMTLLWYYYNYLLILPWHSYTTHILLQWYSWYSYVTPFILLWYSYETPMILLWYS